MNTQNEDNTQNPKEVIIGDPELIKAHRKEKEAQQAQEAAAFAALPLKPLELWTAQKAAESVQISWEKPEKGKIAFLKTAHDLNLTIGVSCKLSDLLTEAIVYPPTEDALTVFYEEKLSFYLTAITYLAEEVVIGKGQYFTKLEEVTMVKGHRSSGNLYLDWTWPTGIETVKIEQSFLGFPRKNRGMEHVTQQIYHQQEFQQKSGFIIKNPLEKDYYFTIYSGKEVEGKIYYSKGVDCKLVNHVYDVKYTISKKFFVGPPCLSITVDATNLTIPAMVLVRRKDQLPLDAEFGETIMEVSSFNTRGEKIELKIDSQWVKKNYYVKLFFKEKEAYEKFKLIAPPKNKLKLA